MMGDGNPCYIAIGPRSIVIKKSKSGIIGSRLFEVRDLKKIERIIRTLTVNFPDDLTPGDLNNRILKSVVNAALHCNELDQLISLFKAIETTHSLPLTLLSPS